MTTDHLATALQTVVRVNDTKLFASLELSKSRWLVTVSAPGSEKLSKHVVIGGDGGALLNLLGRLRASAERRGGMAVQVACRCRPPGWKSRGLRQSAWWQARPAAPGNS